MARHAKRHVQPLLSRHVRDLRTLRQGQRAAGGRPAAAALLTAPPAPPPRRSFHWAAGATESLLVPRLLQATELPSVQDPAVRQLITLTATGQPTPPGLRQALLAVDLATLQAAIVEGIHRWHSYR